MDFYMRVLWEVLRQLHPDSEPTPDPVRRDHRDIRQLFGVLLAPGRQVADIEDLRYILQRAARVLRPQDGELYRRPSYGVYILRKEALQFLRDNAKEGLSKSQPVVQASDLKEVLTSPEEPRTDDGGVTLRVPRSVWDRVCNQKHVPVDTPQVTAPKSPTANDTTHRLLGATELLQRLSNDAEVPIEIWVGGRGVVLNGAEESVLQTIPGMQLLVKDITDTGNATGLLQGDPNVVRHYYNEVLSYNAKQKAFAEQIDLFLKIGSKRSQQALQLLVGDNIAPKNKAAGPVSEVVASGKVVGKTKDYVKVTWPAEKLDELYQQYV